MSVMMQCQCPACGRSSRIPVDEALPCCWCGNLLNTSAEKKAAPLAEPEPKPKIRLEKAPRVNLSKDDLPASPAVVLPQRVPKSKPVPQTHSDAEAGASPDGIIITPETIEQAKQSLKKWNTIDWAIVAGQFLLSFPFILEDARKGQAAQGWAVFLFIFTIWLIIYGGLSGPAREQGYKILMESESEINNALKQRCVFMLLSGFLAVSAGAGLAMLAGS